MSHYGSGSTPFTRFFILTMLSLALILPVACGGGGGGDDTATVPTVTSTTPTDGASQLSTSVVVTVEFSEPMNQSTVEGATAVVANGAMPMAATYTWLTGSQVRINFTKTEDTLFTITIGTGAEDAEGTALASAYIFSFSTGSVPTVEGTYPLHMATDVALGTTVSLDFSEAMDTVDIDEYVFMSGYSGTVNFSWSAMNTHLMASFVTSLDADSPYSVSILGSLEDAQGTPLGSTYLFTFTTGTTFPSGAISGTIGDDPDSPYDDILENTTVALFNMSPFSDTTDGEEPAAAVNCDAGGAYHFSYLADDSYWLIAIQESNGDGTIGELETGDSIGVYMNPSVMSSVPVAGSLVPGIDFDLYDPEAITGDVSYAGMYAGDLSSLTNSLFFYAYTGDYAIEGTIYLTNDPEIIGTSDGNDSADFKEGAGTWTYWLTPFFNEQISVLGSYDGMSWTGALTGLDYIPAGTYNVLARLDHPDGEAFGFAQDAASISGTGDDAVGIDVVLYDTVGIYGYAITFDSFVGDGTPYQYSKVSLLGWPLLEAPTNNLKGYFEYFAAPISVPVAIHGEPAPSDADEYLPYNTEYTILDSDSDAEPFEIRFAHWDVIDFIATACSYPGTIDPAKAVIAGMVTDNTGDELPGYEVILSGSTPYYFDSMGACSTGGVTDSDIDGPQFVIFNATIPAGNIGAISASIGGAITDSVSIPIRGGELTLPRIEPSP